MPDSENALSAERRQGCRPSEEFAAYCRMEFEHRLNSGRDFDAETFNRAVELAMQRLRSMEDESTA